MVEDYDEMACVGEHVDDWRLRMWWRLRMGWRLRMKIRLSKR